MDAPLNLAHQHQRKAEYFTKRQNYDAAVSHHKNAQELLLQAFSETSSSSAQESIRLQVDYHSRQQVIIQHRQKEAERRHQQVLEIKQKKENETESLPKKSETSVTKELRMQAMKAMVKHDSLLEGVFTGTLFSSDNCSTDEVMSHSVGNVVKTGVKSPKDDAVRLEELRINNDELKRILFVLISEVEKCHAENKQLRKSLEELQKIHESCPPPSKARPSDVAQNSSSGFFSVQTDKRNISGICDLPALAPIEMAKSDFYQE